MRRQRGVDNQMRHYIELVHVPRDWRPLDKYDASAPALAVERRVSFATAAKAEAYRRKQNARAMRRIDAGPVLWAIQARPVVVVAKHAPRSLPARRRAVLDLLADPAWAMRSDNWIATAAGVSNHFVKKLRRFAECMAA